MLQLHSASFFTGISNLFIFFFSETSNQLDAFQIKNLVESDSTFGEPLQRVILVLVLLFSSFCPIPFSQSCPLDVSTSQFSNLFQELQLYCLFQLLFVTHHLNVFAKLFTFDLGLPPQPSNFFRCCCILQASSRSFGKKLYAKEVLCFCFIFNNPSGADRMKVFFKLSFLSSF